MTDQRFPLAYKRPVKIVTAREQLDRIRAALQDATTNEYDKLLEITSIALMSRRETMGYLLRWRSDGKVAAGPFAGMLLPPADSVNQPENATLLGCYESELHPVFEAMGSFDTFVDVGAAEGYYTVGCAWRFPHLHVEGFDIDTRARQRADALAAANGVAARVQHHGRLDPAAVAGIPGKRPFMLVDIEGDELTLLPAIPPAERRRWTFLIETHMVADKSTGPAMMALLADSHALEVIQQQPFVPPPEGMLADFTQFDRFAAVFEGRGADPWILARPR